MRLTSVPSDNHPHPQDRHVRCPACGQAALYAPQNPYRPFCGARCKGIDLGDWASESFRVRAQDPLDDLPNGLSPE